eukprot:TRINITY_DN5548_c0_g1_i5.p1 TRINITY_DN5548_c0_g1~~TRINITY_DN5548_c0_g1_i5.p1  ORF type:complete len:406 (+),score=13.46 TRINITY_DN5548_c0_g1_i5:67-1284(+)
MSQQTYKLNKIFFLQKSSLSQLKTAYSYLYYSSFSQSSQQLKIQKYESQPSQTFSAKDLIQIGQTAKFNGYKTLREALQQNSDFILQYSRTREQLRSFQINQIAQIKFQSQNENNQKINNPDAYDNDVINFCKFLDVDSQKLYQIFPSYKDFSREEIITQVWKSALTLQDFGIDSQRIKDEIIQGNFGNKKHGWFRIRSDEIKRIYFELKLMGFQKDLLLKTIFSIREKRAATFVHDLRNLQYILEDAEIIDIEKGISFAYLISNSPNILLIQPGDLLEKILLIKSYLKDTESVRQLLLNSSVIFRRSAKYIRKQIQFIEAYQVEGYIQKNRWIQVISQKKLEQRMNFVKRRNVRVLYEESQTKIFHKNRNEIYWQTLIHKRDFYIWLTAIGAEQQWSDFLSEYE